MNTLTTKRVLTLYKAMRALLSLLPVCSLSVAFAQAPGDTIDSLRRLDQVRSLLTGGAAQPQAGKVTYIASPLLLFDPYRAAVSVSDRPSDGQKGLDKNTWDEVLFALREGGLASLTPDSLTAITPESPQALRDMLYEYSRHEGEGRSNLIRYQRHPPNFGFIVFRPTIVFSYKDQARTPPAMSAFLAHRHPDLIDDNSGTQEYFTLEAFNDTHLIHNGQQGLGDLDWRDDKGLMSEEWWNTYPLADSHAITVMRNDQIRQHFSLMFLKIVNTATYWRSLVDWDDFRTANGFGELVTNADEHTAKANAASRISRWYLQQSTNEEIGAVTGYLEERVIPATTKKLETANAFDKYIYESQLTHLRAAVAAIKSNAGRTLKPAHKAFVPCEVRFRAFIPCQVVGMPINPGPLIGSGQVLNPSLEGDDRQFSYGDGTHRAAQTVRFLLGESKQEPFVLRDVQREWGVSSAYHPSQTSQVPGRPYWWHRLNTNAIPVDSQQLLPSDWNNKASVESDANGNVAVTMLLDASVPVLDVAPKLNANMSLQLKREEGNGHEESCQVLFDLRGSHDSFPSYEIYINRELVYKYSAESGPGPAGLFGRSPVYRSPVYRVPNYLFPQVFVHREGRVSLGRIGGFGPAFGTVRIPPTAVPGVDRAGGR